MNTYREASHLNIQEATIVCSMSGWMCQDLGFSSAKIFNFAQLQSSDVDTDEVLEKFRQKINISRHVDVWRCEVEGAQDCC